MRKELRKLTKSLSKTENNLKNQVNLVNGAFSTIYRSIIQDGIPLYRTKKGKNEGDLHKEYGYFITSQVGYLYIILRRLGKYKLLDLGSGPGIILMTLHHFLRSKRIEHRLAGYENEKSICRTR